MKCSILPVALIAGVLILNGCKKDPAKNTDDTTSSTTDQILESFSKNVTQATYHDLALKTQALHNDVLAFEASQTDMNLTTCKQAWRDARAAWEQSEGFLFGPVATENIDPRIDTWPVNFTDLDSILNSNATFTTTYIDSLEDALKGFHPSEYLLFGINGNKVANQFTARQIDYLKALTLNISTLTNYLDNRWNPQASGNYHTQFINAGKSGSIYSSQQAAFQEIAESMAGICDEVANGKMSEPFLQHDASLEESPFSFNSLTDFTNNIKSVQIAYLGKYTTDGLGLEDLVRVNNLSLDADIKSKISASIAALNNITVPFGQAITQQPVQVQNAIDAINNLKDEIENDLLPFVLQHTK